MSESLFCIEVTLANPHAALESAIEEALWQLGAEGVERHDGTTFSNLVEDPRPYARGTVRWRVYMEPPDDEDETVEAYREILGEVASVEGWSLDDLSFMTAWKAFFASDRVVVYPPWDVPALDPGVVGVEIEPGMAFGTGTHETTRLCIRALDRLVTPGATVLDVGCGSGVLAIAAAKLGAGAVDAIDNDPDAVRIANENFAINGVAVTASTEPLESLSGARDIVVANILPHVLIALRAPLLRLTAGSGSLVLSGIIDEHRQSVVDAFDTDGDEVVRQERDGEWWALEVRRG